MMDIPELILIYWLRIWRRWHQCKC